MNDSLNRRDFFTAGAVAAGGLALSSNLFAQGSQSINVGIIGCGGRGSGAIRNILDGDKDVKIAAICDLHENKAKGLLASLKKKNAGTRRLGHGRDRASTASTRLQEAALDVGHQLCHLGHAARLPALYPPRPRSRRARVSSPRSRSRWTWQASAGSWRRTRSRRKRD